MKCALPISLHPRLLGRHTKCPSFLPTHQTAGTQLSVTGGEKKPSPPRCLPSRKPLRTKPASTDKRTARCQRLRRAQALNAGPSALILQSATLRTHSQLNLLPWPCRKEGRDEIFLRATPFPWQRRWLQGWQKVGERGVVEREERKGRNHHRRRGNRSVGSRCSGGKHGCQGLFAVDAGAILCQGHV